MKNEPGIQLLNNKILIIDDEQMIIDSVKQVLKREGYEILSAKNGKEGLEIFNKEKPVLILLDLKMQAMDGIEFLSHMTFLSSSDLYSVIVITGHGDDEDMERCFKLGVSAFLRKPFNGFELLGLVRHSINLNQAQHELNKYRDHLENMVKERTAELKNANEQLRKLSTAVEQSPSMVMITDTNGNIEYVNPKFTQMTGYTLEEVVGKTPHILNSGKQHRGVYQRLWATITSGNEWHGELHNRKKDGKLFWEAVSISPIKDSKNVITCFIKNAEDITNRKLAEDELVKHHRHLEEIIEDRTAELKKSYEKLVHSEKLGAIGKLSASIAHEFNNPIFGILNVLEQIREGVQMDDKMKELVDMAIRECDRISGSIRKLNDFYRPSLDIKAAMNIHEAIDDILLLCKKKFESRKIESERNYAPEMPDITAVSDQIKQVILNLLNNAEQAISKDGGKISISTEILKSKIKIHIQDSGHGIKHEDIKFIFEPFFTTKAVKGTGLGLSVSYGIIKQHGGDIEVKSKPGEGTTFTITLPLN